MAWAVGAAVTCTCAADQWRKAVWPPVSKRAPRVTDQVLARVTHREKRAWRTEYQTQAGLGVRAQRVPGAGARERRCGRRSRALRAKNNSACLL
jgi:hypothetical protein